MIPLCLSSDGMDETKDSLDSVNYDFVQKMHHRRPDATAATHTGLRYQINYLANFSESPKMHSKSFICPS